tara:strand:- start:33 stop:221 length:189 start_codon:yes stop_codon:yes gene_type:complete
MLGMDFGLWKQKSTIAVASLEAGSMLALVNTDSAVDMLVGMAQASMPVGTNVDPLRRRNWAV